MFRTSAARPPAEPHSQAMGAAPAARTPYPRHAPHTSARRLYVGVIFGAGLALFVASLLSAPVGDPLAALFIIALVAVSEGFAVRLYSDGHVSVSFMGVIVAALALGPAAAALAATTVALVLFLAQERALNKLFFNLGQQNIAAFFVAQTALAFDTHASAHLFVAAPLGAVLGSELFLITSSAVTLAIALTSGARITDIHRQSFRWMLPHYLGLGGVAGGLAYVLEEVGLAALITLSIPLALSRLSIKQVIDKTRETVSALETANARLRKADEANRAILEAIPDTLFRLHTEPGSAQVTMALRSDSLPPLLPPLPEEAPEVLGKLSAAAAATGRPELLEYRVGEGPDARYFEARVVPTRESEPLLMVRDISDRKKAEIAERVSGQLRRTVTASTPLMLFAADADRRVNLLEGRGLADAGLDPVALLGKPLAEVLGERVFLAEALELIARGQVVNTTAEIGGRIFELHLSPASDDDASLVGVGLDVTDRRRAEDAMIQAQKLESLGVMAGGIAHDFNNLLVGIIGNAELALAELPGDAPVADTVLQVKLAGQRAAELARQMLAYSGKGRLVVEPVDPGLLVTETSKLLRSSIGRRILLDIETEPGLPCVEADATQIRQVVMNLVINASDAIGDAEGHIRVSTRAVSVSDTELAETYGAPDLTPGDYVCIEVSDTGSGMNAETMSRIFDPFFTTKPTGHGLGLAGALGITRSHKGSIKVDSEPGRGTRFTILLPALGGQPQRGAARVAEAAKWHGSGTILVVDDDETVRLLVARAARQFGLDVIEAEDGLAGVELYRAHQEAIDCVLLDMTMPRMNGDEAILRIREMNPEAPVVLMSGYAEDEAAARALGQQPNAFMHKPFSLDGLRDTLHQVIDSPAREQDLAA